MVPCVFTCRKNKVEETKLNIKKGTNTRKPPCVFKTQKICLALYKAIPTGLATTEYRLHTHREAVVQCYLKDKERRRPDPLAGTMLGAVCGVAKNDSPAK
jgi:hypothetical protein